MSNIYRHNNFNLNNQYNRNQNCNLHANTITSRLKNPINQNITKDFFDAKIIDKNSVLLKRVMEHKKQEITNEYYQNNNNYYPVEINTSKKNSLYYTNQRQSPKYYIKKVKNFINEDINNLEDSYAFNINEQIPEKHNNKKDYIFGNYLQYLINDNISNTYNASENVLQYNSNISLNKNSTPYYNNSSSFYKIFNEAKINKLSKTNKIPKKFAISMKNINQDIDPNNMSVADYYRKVPYKKQLLHGITPITSLPLNKKTLYMNKDFRENNGNKNLRYKNMNDSDGEDNYVKSVVLRNYNNSNQRSIKTMKKNNTNSSSINRYNRSLGFRNQSFQIIANKKNRNDVIKNQKLYINKRNYPMQLIYSFVTHLNNYCYYYFMKILRIFFDGFKNKYKSKIKSKNFISVYQRLNYHKPQKLSITNINNNINYLKDEPYHRINRNSSTLGNENKTAYQKYLETKSEKPYPTKRNFTCKNSLYSSMIKEKIRESKSKEKSEESELCRNLNELNKKYEIILLRKNRNSNGDLNSHKKSENNDFEENNSIDYDRKTLISEKQKFDRNVERIRQRSKEIKKIRQENERKKIAQLSQKIREKKEEIQKLKKDKMNKILEEKNKNNLTNKKIEIIKTISKKNITNMITIKNIVTADKKIKIHMNYLNCIFPKKKFGKGINNKLEICKEFTIMIAGESNNKCGKNSTVVSINRLYNKLSEIKEEEEVKEENKNDITK